MAAARAARGSLKTYHKKRNFKLTAEPKGSVARKIAKHSYCIQKHDASRLHFDFRLEWRGTLKSWAVPKGPSLDPHVKRLAVQVEDHPTDYGDFEGTIPKGEYGGGTVMLWDEGTWEPIDDPDVGLRKGKLTFRISGKRLEGEWTLVRAHGGRYSSDEGKNWFLIKHKDSNVRENGKEPVELELRSVKSGRTMNEIADHVPHTSDTVLPDQLKPELCTLVDEVPQGAGWIHEVKYDGYRILTFLTASGVRFQSRNQREWTDKLPTLQKQLALTHSQDTLLDGELVAISDEGLIDFQLLQNSLDQGAEKNLAYYVFDLPFFEGEDLRKKPLHERKKILKKFLSKHSKKLPNIFFSESFQTGEDLFAQGCKMGLEGIVSKRSDSQYESRRSQDWLKVKCTLQQEFIVLGYTEPQGSRSGFGALLLGVEDSSHKIRYAGRVGTGFNEATLKRLKKLLDAESTEKSPLSKLPRAERGANVTWVRPGIICEVKFAQWTREGVLRHAVFQGLTEDKTPKDVHREVPQKIPRPTQKREGKRIGETIITHPERILYPKLKFTKADLAQYFEAVWPFMEAHIKNRPLSLVRCPQGPMKKCFFQKHLTGSQKADHIQSISIQEKNDASEYVIPNEARDMVSLVQMGIVEVHVWGSRHPKVEYPDMITFDLDPDPSVKWDKVIAAAKRCKEYLDLLQLKSFVKTTGGKGLHVVVPIVPKYTWEEVYVFTRGFVDMMVQEHPKDFTGNLSKAARKGKIFIDYLRNHRGSTAVAAYSPRARAEGTVSMPIKWSEVSLSLDPKAYTVVTVPRLIKRRKTDPWPNFYRIRQGLPK